MKNKMILILIQKVLDMMWWYEQRGWKKFYKYTKYFIWFLFVSSHFFYLRWRTTKDGCPFSSISFSSSAPSFAWLSLPLLSRYKVFWRCVDYSSTTLYIYIYDGMVLNFSYFAYLFYFRFCFVRFSSFFHCFTCFFSMLCVRVSVLSWNAQVSWTEPIFNNGICMSKKQFFLPLNMVASEKAKWQKKM